MTLSFNTSGNLHKTVELSFEEFQHHFGTTPPRKDKIEAALLFFKIFSSCGCTAVFIGGSFVSKKKNPADIDICFDITGINEKKLKEEFPGFFGPNRHNKIGEIRRDHKCHIFTFDKDDTVFFEFLQKDRFGYPKGLVKISLKK